MLWFSQCLKTGSGNNYVVLVGSLPVPDAVLAIQDGKIVHAGPATDWRDNGEEWLNLDLHGQFVLPGPIDAHVHLSGSGEADSQFRADHGNMTLKILSNAQKKLSAGITTVRDLGGWNELEFAVRTWIQEGAFAGPRMCLAGRFISITEAGADYYEGMYRVADGVDEVRRAVREQVKHGADLIKIGVTGAVLVENGAPGATHFKEDEIHALVQEAGKFGRSVAAHAHGEEGMLMALHAGVWTIEHGTFLHRSPEAISYMAEYGIFLLIGCVTAVPTETLAPRQTLARSSKPRTSLGALAMSKGYATSCGLFCL